jgi:hypothetical protein
MKWLARRWGETTGVSALAALSAATFSFILGDLSQTQFMAICLWALVAFFLPEKKHDS